MIPAVEDLLVRPRQDAHQVQQVLQRPRAAEDPAVGHPVGPPEQLDVHIPRDVDLGLQHHLQGGRVVAGVPHRVVGGGGELGGR